jgi:hypothetical protein
MRGHVQPFRPGIMPGTELTQLMNALERITQLKLMDYHSLARPLDSGVLRLDGGKR